MHRDISSKVYSLPYSASLTGVEIQNPRQPAETAFVPDPFPGRDRDKGMINPEKDGVWIHGY
jgi:hypothetical protein